MCTKRRTEHAEEAPQNKNEKNTEARTYRRVKVTEEKKEKSLPHSKKIEKKRIKGMTCAPGRAPEVEGEGK